MPSRLAGCGVGDGAADQAAAPAVPSAAEAAAAHVPATAEAAATAVRAAAHAAETAAFGPVARRRLHAAPRFDLRAPVRRILRARTAS